MRGADGRSGGIARADARGMPTRSAPASAVVGRMTLTTSAAAAPNANPPICAWYAYGLNVRPASDALGAQMGQTDPAMSDGHLNRSKE